MYRVGLNQVASYRCPFFVLDYNLMALRSLLLMRKEGTTTRTVRSTSISQCQIQTTAQAPGV